MNNNRTKPEHSEDDDFRGYIRILVFRFGAVSGAVRRLVYAFPGEFTIEKMKRLLGIIYPGLTPGEFQVEDCIKSMLREKRIVCTGQNDTGEDTYKVCEYVPWYLRNKKPRVKQMELRLVTN